MFLREPQLPVPQNNRKKKPSTPRAPGTRSEPFRIRANQRLHLRLDYQYRTIYTSVTQIIYEIEYDRGFSGA